MKLLLIVAIAGIGGYLFFRFCMYLGRPLYLQNACMEMKDQISIIWVVTNSLLIRMGASNVISVFTSLKIKVVGTENEIQI